MTADRARAVVTAAGPTVVAALSVLLQSADPVPPSAPSITRVAEALAGNDISVGPLVRQLSLLRQVLHLHVQRLLPVNAMAEAEHQLDVALDSLVEACAARAAERLEEDALVDPLTGLLNRRALERDLSREMAVAERRGRPLSVLTADVDGLKKVNDGQGHTKGDEVLRSLAGAFRAALRGGDSAYRVGGDEFVVLLPDMAAEAVPGFVGRVRAAAPPSFSWGAATFPDEVDNRPSLLDLADRRLLGYRQAAGSGRPTAITEVLTAGPVIAGRPSGRLRRHSSLMVATFLAGVLLGGASLGSAATGTLPRPMQNVAHSVLAKVGVPVPAGRAAAAARARQNVQPVERFAHDGGTPCTYPDGSQFAGTHGEYVATHPDDATTPQNERQLASQSRCGKPKISANVSKGASRPGPADDPGSSGESGRPDGAGKPDGTGRPDHVGRTEDVRPATPVKPDSGPPDQQRSVDPAQGPPPTTTTTTTSATTTTTTTSTTTTTVPPTTGSSDTVVEEPVPTTTARRGGGGGGSKPEDQGNGRGKANPRSAEAGTSTEG
ncbi:MAG TPA: GGDEF domain-containing protein [Acidimicrobiales bacterium]|nr:GGDEF domain-containing protein [Acidimicrobiales bacterium]